MGKTVIVEVCQQENIVIESKMGNASAELLSK